MKTRTEYNWDELDFSYGSMISHDPFLEAFKESFRVYLLISRQPISL